MSRIEILALVMVSLFLGNGCGGSPETSSTAVQKKVTGTGYFKGDWDMEYYLEADDGTCVDVDKKTWYSAKPGDQYKSKKWRQPAPDLSRPKKYSESIYEQPTRTFAPSRLDGDEFKWQPDHRLPEPMHMPRDSKEVPLGPTIEIEIPAAPVRSVCPGCRDRTTSTDSDRLDALASVATVLPLGRKSHSAWFLPVLEGMNIRDAIDNEIKDLKK